MANFPQGIGKTLSSIYTTVDGIYSLKDQQRLEAGGDWPPSFTTPAGTPTNGGTFDYFNSTTYTFDGTQTSATDLSSGISLGVLADFDLEFDLYHEAGNGNDWMLNNGGYNETNGILIGLYNSAKVAIAGNGIGGYGYYSSTDTTLDTWMHILIECRFSGSTKTIHTYYDGTSQGQNSGYTTTGINWNRLYIGMGKSQDSDNWSSAFYGSIKNIGIVQR